MAKQKKKERTNHWLRPNHGAAIPTNLVFVQTWSAHAPHPDDPTQEIHRLDFGIVHFCRYMEGRIQRWKKLTFNTTEQFWTFFTGLHRENTSIWIIGYKVAQTFTLLRGWDQVDRGIYTLIPAKRNGKVIKEDEPNPVASAGGWFVDSDPPTIILLHTGSCVIHIVDIRNYGNLTMKELQAATGETELLPDRDGAPFAKYAEYVNSMTIACREYFLRLIGWWSANKLGVWRHTAGALAMAAFRHAHMHPKSILVHDCEQALTLERQALAGGEFRPFFAGRVQEFWDFHRPEQMRGKMARKRRVGPVFVYDCNSLYPSVMQNNLFPRELVTWKDHADFDDFHEWRKKLCIIANVRLATDTRAYPWVYENERIWAHGRYSTTLAGPELCRAVDDGHVLEFGMMAVYWPGRIFQSYVDWFHGERLKAIQAGKEIDQLFHKLLLNALPGKFAQKHHQWDFVPMRNPLPERYGSFPCVNDDGEIKNYRVIAGYVQEEQIQGESLESCPAITAFVNSYARMAMEDVRLALGDENIYYLANDALHVNELGSERMERFIEKTRGEIGKFKLKGKYATAEYRGPHDYTLDGRFVVAGRRAEDELVLDGQYEQAQEQSLKTIIQRQPGGTMLVRKIKKTFGRFHPKGIWLADGRVVPPVVVDGVPSYRAPGQRRPASRQSGKSK